MKAETVPIRLEWRDPADLAENPANWRKHPAAQSRALTELIDEVGWAGALLYNEATGRLIDGHLRRGIGRGQVPVLVGRWSEAQERKILATLDPLGAMAETDSPALAGLLAEVEADGAGRDLIAELEAQASLEAEILAAIEAGDDPDRESMAEGRKAGQSDRTKFVKVVVACRDVADIEEAIRRTGKVNRAEALLEVARYYLKNAPLASLV